MKLKTLALWIVILVAMAQLVAAFGITPARAEVRYIPDDEFINTFRVVFNCILRERLELLPTRIFSRYKYNEMGFREVGVREMIPDSPTGLHFDRLGL